MGVTLSVLDLDQQLTEAAETDRRLPRAIRKRSALTYWPDYQAEWLSYADSALRMILPRATAEQIGRYDKVCALVLKAPEQDRRLVWLCAHSSAFRQRGPAWGKVAKRLHMDRRKVKREYLRILYQLTTV
jgi:hypothetical protein